MNRKEIFNEACKIDKILGHPHRHYPIIHVTGTDGKGSTSSMIASILIESGYKTGTFNTPGIDAAKINGKSVISKMINIKNEIKKIIKNNNINFNKELIPTFLTYFKNENVDIAVIESQVGAATDSTNVVHPIISVITNITPDHLEMFNNSFIEYAYEKSGIIKTNAPVFVGETPTNNEVKNILLNKAQECNTSLIFTDEKEKNLIMEYKGLGKYKTKYGEFTLELGADYQLMNLNLVLNVIEELKKIGYVITNDNIVKGLENVVKNTNFLGRWQILHRKPTVILDACHTPNAFRKVMTNLLKMDYNRLHMIVSTYNNRDINKIVETFCDDEKVNYYFPKTRLKRLIKPCEMIEATNWMKKSKRYESDYIVKTIDELIKKSNKNDIIS